MRIRCDRLDLVDRLSSILGIISTNTPKVILGDFLLEAVEDRLIAEATDLDISGRVFMHRVEVAERGCLALPSGNLLAVLKEIPEDAVEIATSGDTDSAELGANGFRFKLVGHAPDSFPRSEDLSDTHVLVVRRDRLLESLRRVVVATSKDATRYQLNGVYLELAGGWLSLTATDGKRLGHDRLKLEEDSGLELTALLPNHAVDVFLKVMASPAGEGETVELQVSETHVALCTDNTRITSTQIEGRFPKYTSVFPQETHVRARGKRLDLLSAARSAALTTDKKTSTVLFKFTPEGLDVESNSSDVGESRIHVPLTLEGDGVDFRFNPVYLIDALRTFDEEEILLELTSSSKPVVLKGSQNYVHLVMPLVQKGG